MNKQLQATLSSYWLWVGLVIFVFLPVFLNGYYMSIAITTLVMIGFCIAWNISGGITGQFSFAHTLFIAAGAYTSASLYVHLNISPWIGLICGAIVAAILGAFISWICHRFKLPSISVALITLALGTIGLQIIMSLEFLGSHAGLLIPRSENNSFLNLPFQSINSYYYLMLIVALIFLILTLKIFDSKVGYYLKAIRDNEDAAEALGINTLKYKMISMVISAIFSSIVGVIYAQFLMFVEPETFAGPVLMIQVILMTVLGGLGTAWGPVIGALILTPVDNILSGVFGQLPGLSLLFYGLLIVIVILTIPRGLISLIPKKKNPTKRKNI